MSANTTQPVGDFVSITRQAKVAVVTFDRRDNLNALSAQAMDELKAAAELLSSATGCGSIVLTGGSHFSAGADLRDKRLSGDAGESLLQRREAAKRGPDMCQTWADLEQVTICAIERFCIGGGLALAAACDHRIAATDSHFRLPEIPMGMNMSWRSVPRLVALLGPSRAKELIILGRKIESEEALRWGLIDRVADPGGALDAAMEMAVAYADLPPIPARMAKQAIDTTAMPLGYATSFMDRDQFLLTRTVED